MRKLKKQYLQLCIVVRNFITTSLASLDIPIGDALSRANVPESEPDIEPVVVNMISYIAVSPDRYNQFQLCTANELN